MDPLRKEITKNDQLYVFRYPSGMDMIKVDLKAREIRQGISDGLSVAIPYAYNIALLNHLCTEPKSTDFGDLPEYIMDEIAGEVSQWLDSFRKPVGKEPGTVDTKQGQ